jgi:neurofibromin 1
MGYLAREEVDDDLLYQVLVALRNSVNRFGEDSSTEMLLAIITSLSKMMAKLPSASRYGLQLFWLAMSLVRLVPAGLFNCTAQFLDAVLTNIGTVGEIKGEKMVSLLLQGRVPLEEAALPLDAAYGVHFTEETFHYAVCACLARGLTDTMTRANTLGVLSSFLDMTSWSSDPEVEGATPSLLASPYLTLIRARAVGSDELKDSMWLSGATSEGANGILGNRQDINVELIKDEDLMLISAIELVDFQYLEDSVQAQTLAWLDRLATSRPGVILQLLVLWASMVFQHTDSSQMCWVETNPR